MDIDLIDLWYASEEPAMSPTMAVFLIITKKK